MNDRLQSTRPYILQKLCTITLKFCDVLLCHGFVHKRNFQTWNGYEILVQNLYIFSKLLHIVVIFALYAQIMYLIALVRDCIKRPFDFLGFVSL